MAGLFLCNMWGIIFMASTQMRERSMTLRQSNLRANNTLSNMVLQFSFPLFEQCKITLGSTLGSREPLHSYLIRMPELQPKLILGTYHQCQTCTNQKCDSRKNPCNNLTL